jgi:subtilase family serine protease
MRRVCKLPRLRTVPAERNRRFFLKVEELEERALLSVFAPAQIRHAYGFDQVSFANARGQVIPGDGRGQTIAIIDAFDAPGLVSETSTAYWQSDLAKFDRTFGIADPPSFKKVDVNGTAHYPARDPSWALESVLDVEWAHAIAPRANILLVEAPSDSIADLLTAVNYARKQPAVTVISMSWGGQEAADESTVDKIFTTPLGHAGITFVAASGDDGSGQTPLWPAASPNVVSVGGTQLWIRDNRGTYGGESAWDGGNRGSSLYEPEPTYQRRFQSTGKRIAPDVAYNADPAAGYYVYATDPISHRAAWYSVGGTSAGAPQWAALIAIVEQGRALAGKGSLDGATQTLPALYQLPAQDFHDITSGSPATQANAGFDPATGRGSPVADRLIPDLVKAL